MAGTYRALGVTLMARKYRGTGRVLTLFTRERGKVEAVAQGIGKPGSSLSAAADLFAVSEMLLVQGRDLDRLTQARVVQAHEGLRRRPVALGYAGFLAELLGRATEPGHPIAAAFGEAVAALGLLAAGQEPAPVVASTAWRLLADLGVGPDLGTCARCGAEAPAATVYLARDGGVICPNCFTLADGEAETSVPVTPQLRSLVATLADMPLERLPRVKVDAGLWDALLRLVRLQVRFYLGLELRADEYLRQVLGRRGG